jgi:5'-nucleotidase
VNTPPRLELLIDQDGPLAQFNEYVTEQVAKHPVARGNGWLIEPDSIDQFLIADVYADTYGPDARSIIYEICSTPGFFASLPPVPGAREGMNALLDLGHSIRICTSPLLANPTGASEKFTWAATHLGPGWDARVTISKDKTVVRGHHLLDDKPSITGEFTPMWTQVLWDTPYNRHVAHLDRVASWAEFIAWVTDLNLTGREPVAEIA